MKKYYSRLLSLLLLCPVLLSLLASPVSAAEEEDELHELAANGVELEIRQVPTEKKELYK